MKKLMGLICVMLMIFSTICDAEALTVQDLWPEDQNEIVDLFQSGSDVEVIEFYGEDNLTSDPSTGDFAVVNLFPDAGCPEGTCWFDKIFTTELDDLGVFFFTFEVINFSLLGETGWYDWSGYRFEFLPIDSNGFPPLVVRAFPGQFHLPEVEISESRNVVSYSGGSVPIFDGEHFEFLVFAPEPFLLRQVAITDVLDISDSIDIKPGSDPNSINCNNDNEVITVAILTTDDFDATTVDHTTVTLEGAGETHVDKKSGEPRRHEEDVDDDGDTDLVFHFRLGDTDLTCDSVDATLKGETFDGQAIQGTDSVRMVEGGGA